MVKKTEKPEGDAFDINQEKDVAEKTRDPKSRKSRPKGDAFQINGPTNENNSKR
ncbi:MAG: hypothetical protein HKO02_09775 [Hyphomonadaceae bacterium]|nr:hypothetical protein [Hyphomonadaceae bacterium]